MKKELKVLASEWHGCQRCGLGKERSGSRVVFGLGRGTAKYLLIYDTPTAEDESAGHPMAGRHGELLLELLSLAKIDAQDVYCTPLVACRPVRFLAATADKPAQEMDRNPTKEELTACAPRVTELIYRIDPRLIFTLGPIAWQQLVRPKDRGVYTNLDKALGELFVTHIPGRWMRNITYDVIPLLAMNQIIAAPSLAAHGPIAMTAKYLYRGRTYVEFVEKTGQRDAATAGFSAPEADEPRVGTSNPG